MNVTEQGLLHAIAHEPDDDTHRLVYADWLDDHGDEDRAEFIRAQVRLAADNADSPSRRELAFRASQLLDQDEAEWMDSIAEVAVEWTFRRGFPEVLALEAEDLDALRPGGLLHRLPVRRLAVFGLGEMAQLREIDANNRLVGLDLTGNEVRNDDLRALVQLPAFQRLQTLSLQCNRLDDESIGFLSRSALLRGLRCLRLGGNPFTPEGRSWLRGAFGESLTFRCEREPDRLYAFNDDYFQTGTLPGHRQGLFEWFENEMHLAVFDFEGILLEILRRPFEAGDQNGRRQESRAWREDVGWEGSRIHIRRFRYPHDPNVGIHDFNWWADAFDRGEHEGNDLYSAVRRWLIDGQFEWRYAGDNCWLDRAGEVTDT